MAVFAAASNDGNRAGIAYPASLGYSDTFCIHATDGAGNKSSFSPPAEHGRENCSILGQSMKSLWSKEAGADRAFMLQGTLWKVASGTSVAAPMAASVACLILEYMRANLPKSKHREVPATIRSILLAMSERQSSSSFNDIIPWKLFDSDVADLLDVIIERIIRKVPF